MDKSTHNPVGLAADSSHGSFLLLSSLFVLSSPPSLFPPSFRPFSFPFKQVFFFFGCVCFGFLSSFFFQCQPSPQKNWQLPVWWQTYRQLSSINTDTHLPAAPHTHSPQTSPSSPPNANRLKTTIQHIGFHVTLPPGSGALEMFETHPHSSSSLGKETQAGPGLHFKFRGLGLSLWDSWCDLTVTCG